MTTTEQPSIEVIVRGEVADSDCDRAVEKMRDAFAASPRPILFARLELRAEPNPAMERPAVVKAMADVSGTPVRAHRAAGSMDLAIDEAVDRIRRNIRRLAERREDRVHEPARTEDGEWRHGALPTVRPAYFPRPVEEREVVRHKSYSVGRMTPEEAAFEMVQLDYDFHLFVDAATGADAVIERRDDGELELVSAEQGAGAGPAGEPAEVEVLPAPRMGSEAAVARLDAGEEPRVAYLDESSDRLNVVYRRYDGHYGLIAPYDAAPSDGASPAGAT